MNALPPPDGSDRQVLRATVAHLAAGHEKTGAASVAQDRILHSSLSAIDDLSLLVPGPGFDRRARRLTRTLKSLAARSRRCLRMIDAANESVDRAHSMLNDLIAGTGGGVPGFPHAVRDLDVKPPRSGGGRREVIINGETFLLSHALAKTLEILAEDDGRSDDEFVGFKPRAVLKKRLRITKGNLATRIERLRKFFEEIVGIEREVVESDPNGGGYRIRLLAAPAADPVRNV